MPRLRLTLSRKIFLALAALLIVLLLSFAGLSILALQRGLGAYVAEIEIRRMDWLSQLVLKHYVLNGDWKSLRDNDEAWHRLQMGRVATVLDNASTPDDRRLPPWYEYRTRGAPPEGSADNGPPPM
ncbi:two-component sensor histidine kinase, partial [Variovorax sp. CT11-76]